MTALEEMMNAEIARLSSQFGTNDSDTINLALNLWKSRKTNRAIQKIKESGSAEKDLFLFLGNNSYVHRRFREAIKYYEEDLEARFSLQRTSWDNLNIGCCYYNLKDFEKAREHLDKAKGHIGEVLPVIGLSSDSCAARDINFLYWILSYKLSGDERAERRFIREIFHKKGDERDINYNIIISSFPEIAQLRNPDEMFSYYREILRNNPHIMESHINSSIAELFRSMLISRFLPILPEGLIYFIDYQEKRKAEMHYKRAIKIEPKNPYLYKLLSMTFSDDEVQKAISSLKKCIRLCEPRIKSSESMPLLHINAIWRLIQRYEISGQFNKAEKNHKKRLEYITKYKKEIIRYWETLEEPPGNKEKAFENLITRGEENLEECSKEKLHYEELYSKFKQWVNNLTKNSPELKIHLEAVLKEVEKREEDPPYEMRIMALGHDIERAFKNRAKKKEFSSYKEYKKVHAQRSAEIVAKKLEEFGADSFFIERVGYGIKHHEEGGTDFFEYADIVDQSYLEKIVDNIMKYDSQACLRYSLKEYLDEYGIEALEKKIEFMCNRVPEKNRDVSFYIDQVNAYYFIAEKYKEKKYLNAGKAFEFSQKANEIITKLINNKGYRRYRSQIYQGVRYLQSFVSI